MSDFPPGNTHARWVEPGAEPSAGVADTTSAAQPSIARVAVLPTVVMAVLGAAAAVLLAKDHSTGMIVGVLVGGIVGAGIVLAWSATGAKDAARAVQDRINELSLVAGAEQHSARSARQQLIGVQQAHMELQQAYENASSWPARFTYHIEQFAARVRDGERPAVSELTDESGSQVDRDYRAAVHAAEFAIVQSAEPNVTADPMQRLQVFANLGRRLQSLVNREIQMLDELEKQIEDPETLEGIFAVDHLATRIRRQAENLGVLGGARAPRQWTKPLTMVTTLRSAMQEVEHYKRVKMVSPINGTLRGHNVTEIIHLLAELIENATAFSGPETTVMLSAQNVTAGLAIEVEDRGLGIKADDLDRINDLLSGPEISDVGVLLSDGRQIGLWVVAQLARRNDVQVRLARNIFGGVTAAVVVPHSLLGDDTDDAALAQGTHRELVTAGAAPAQELTAPRHGAHRVYSLAGNTSDSLVVPAVPDEQIAPDVEPHVAELDPFRWPGSAGELPSVEPTPVVSTPDPAPPEVPIEQDRPPLPKRQPGTNHLAYELRTPPPPVATATPSAGEHNPSATAAFRSGIRAGSEENGEPVVPLTTRLSPQGESTHHDR
ncbi:MAG TPA: ATP-binding protein [Pseudonocardiaceae bacterium]|jgi:signal transduction histidine kinase